RSRLDEFNGQVRRAGTVDDLRNEGNPIGEPRVSLFLRRQTLMKGIQHRLNVVRQIACPLQDRLLIGAEGDELQRDGQPPLKAVLQSEQLFDGLVEIDAACLKLR